MLSQADSSTMDGSTYTASAQRKARGYVAPSACSQLANHVPAGIKPNVVYMSICIPSSPAFALLPVTPLWGRQASLPKVVTLLVSVVKIEDGEEVLVDYQFSGCSEELPSWYTPNVHSGARDCAGRQGPSFQ